MRADMRCESCRFWEVNASEYPIDPRPNPLLRGQCRKSAPTPLAYIIVARAEQGVGGDLSECAKDTNEVSREALWPETWNVDWCGQHQHE